MIVFKIKVSGQEMNLSNDGGLGNSKSRSPLAFRILTGVTLGFGLVTTVTSCTTRTS